MTGIRPEGVVIPTDENTKAIGEIGILEQRLAYSGNGLVVYQGFARPGANAGSEVWLIKQFTYDSTSLVNVKYAGSKAEFHRAWDNGNGSKYIDWTY